MHSSLQTVALKHRRSHTFNTPGLGSEAGESRGGCRREDGSMKPNSMCRGVITDGESVIAPEGPELIKKQDHTPVQSRERGAVEGGGRRAWTGSSHLSETEI
ncbi:unnamed protein product [Pleuronectes platessa]|uniref:Uncharacterized protein n=1 Tax=Pleuronectes platessa TaxID=8262 RepID=A0A9N7U8H0_PLEPL|nr:unnamed protein product [Pleuronectes platessa]